MAIITGEGNRGAWRRANIRLSSYFFLLTPDITSADRVWHSQIANSFIRLKDGGRSQGQDRVDEGMYAEQSPRVNSANVVVALFVDIATKMVHMADEAFVSLLGIQMVIME